MNPPPIAPPANLPPDDTEHLRLLSIFHYVVAGLLAVFSLFPIFHLAFGIFMLLSPESMEKNPQDATMLRVMGGLFVAIAAMIMLTGLTMAALSAYSGRCLSLRRKYTFSLVMAGVLCLFMPFGTILGVFTIIVLTRPSVKTLYR